MGSVKKPGKLVLLRVMMIVAQLLLIGFVIHWLNIQYHEQQSQLEKDIETAWSKSQQQMVDSMLLKKFIVPAMDSTEKFDLNLEFNTDSIKTMVRGQVLKNILPDIPVPDLPPRHTKIIVNVTDSLNLQEIDERKIQSSLKRDLLLQGVKLFVNRHTDKVGDHEDITEILTDEPDTALLKTAFISHLDSIDPTIRVNWKNLQIMDSSVKDRMISYTLITGDSRLEAGIEGIRMHILRKILPQLSFALLLLILTTAAFIISFRSLKSQIVLNNQRNDFIRNMSHEIRTPVATVKVALEALKNFNRRSEPEVMDEYLDMATAETNRLELLISRVMNISENGDSFMSNLEDVDFNQLITELLQVMKQRIDAEKATVSLQMPEERIILKLDSLHVHGVIMNLLDNSLKYSKAPASIEVELIKEEKAVRLSVSDKGMGISPEYQSRIFEKFYRVPTGDQHNVKGYGLGLSYAKMVMEQHGGKIEFHERTGGGSIFELIFPLS